jgi:hypothetical protein
MALVLRDRVKETTTTTGTGAVTLLGAATGYQAFSAIGNGNITYYTIAGQTSSEWEVGIGTYTSSGTTLSRDTVLASSNSGSLVTFSAGTKDVFCTYPAGKSVNLDASGNATGLGTPAAFVATNVTGLPLTSGVSGVLPTANGGTNLSSFTSGGAVYATSTSDLTTGTLPTTAGGTALTNFTSGGAMYATSTSALTTGTLPIASGGTGATTLYGASISTTTYTSTATAAGTTTLSVSSNTLQFFTGSSTQTILLPNVTTLIVGRRFEIHNNSTGTLTVQTSGGSTISTVPGNTTFVYTCISTGSDVVGSWDSDLQGFTSTLTVSNGGTGLSSATAYAVLCGGTSSAGNFQSVASVGTAGQVLTSNGAGALPTFQTSSGLTQAKSLGLTLVFGF